MLFLSKFITFNLIIFIISSIPLPKDVEHFKRERKLAITKSLQVVYDRWSDVTISVYNVYFTYPVNNDKMLLFFRNEILIRQVKKKPNGSRPGLYNSLKNCAGG